MNNIKFICGCSDLGVDVDGAQFGPTKLLENFKSYNYSIINRPECIKSNDPTDLKKNLKEVNQFNKTLFNEVKAVSESNILPISLGGDHSIVIASALGSKSVNNIGIIWIDAHLDYNTFDTTITGNLHGLPLAAINGLCNELTSFTNNFINPKNTVVVGYRSMEENRDIEMNNIRKSGVTVFTEEDIKTYGIEYVMNKAFEIASNNTDGIHISYDLDVINPIVCPGVSVPELGGLSYSEAITVINMIKNNINLVKSFDLVEFNPLNDIDNKTFNIANEILNILIK